MFAIQKAEMKSLFSFCAQKVGAGPGRWRHSHPAVELQRLPPDGQTTAFPAPSRCPAAAPPALRPVCSPPGPRGCRLLPQLARALDLAP